MGGNRTRGSRSLSSGGSQPARARAHRCYCCHRCHCCCTAPSSADRERFRYTHAPTLRCHVRVRSTRGIARPQRATLGALVRAADNQHILPTHAHCARGGYQWRRRPVPAARRVVRPGVRVAHIGRACYGRSARRVSSRRRALAGGQRAPGVRGGRRADALRLQHGATWPSTPAPLPAHDLRYTLMCDCMCPRRHAEWSPCPCAGGCGP
mmetsp:Transcript_2537/g.6640  ORF Transcript_2537/g.6640 Transcript_2537/m.6640 type:complete len:209 (-) Transcript_2537:748-1374(-)